ncbi:MAG: phosphoribosylformylglycinamidine synthase subunit PurQ [Nitrospiria bacterium]
MAVLVFPGSNCDRDCEYVIRQLLCQSVQLVWHKESNLKGFDLVIIPGGFSYGDYLRAGAIARFSPILAEVEGFARAGGLVIGICNGFQILVEAGILPGALFRNQTLKFICQKIYLKVEQTDTPFTSLYSPSQIIQLPIAHGDGCYWADQDTLAELHQHRRIVFRYCTRQGEATDAANPNGSMENIAGICNKGRNVLGMMPHPERQAEAILGGQDGRLLFESVVQLMAK